MLVTCSLSVLVGMWSNLQPLKSLLLKSQLRKLQPLKSQELKLEPRKSHPLKSPPLKSMAFKLQLQVKLGLWEEVGCFMEIPASE